MTTFTFTGLPLADTWNTMHGGWGWAWMMPMMLGMALFLGAIILGCGWLIRDGVNGHHSHPTETALSILDRRFAEGAVPLDEYQQRRDVLSGATVGHEPTGTSTASGRSEQ